MDGEAVAFAKKNALLPLFKFKARLICMHEWNGASPIPQMCEFRWL